MALHYTYDTLFPSPGFRLHAFRCEIPENWVNFHTHDFAELVVICQGRAVHALEDRKYPIGTGDVFVLPPGTPHGYREIENLELYNVNYDPSLFLEKDSDLQDLPGYHALFHLEPSLRHHHGFGGKLRLAPQQLNEILDTLEVMEDESVGRAPGYKTVLGARFLLLVGFLSRIYEHQETEASRELLNLSQVVTHIETHFAEPMTLDDLARLAHMSKRTLLRHFRRCYNATPVQYLLHHRLKRATHLLKASGARITDVAMATGFSDSNYFSRQFRRLYGMSPRAFRKSKT